jgi:hypothetical protein
MVAATTQSDLCMLLCPCGTCMSPEAGEQLSAFCKVKGVNVPLKTNAIFLMKEKRKGEILPMVRNPIPLCSCITEAWFPPWFFFRGSCPATSRLKCTHSWLSNGIHSEKSIARQFYPSMNIIDCTFTR